ncbi:hypothetical protein F383_38973 [Gossypium arboreum]|uniref:Uncharacterized protein n=1 Tax=Gossypium arboreum TaxID=29729 RepID=A0A0B0MJ72_GOSAR|nr:hypothetical protein F383_38973 [Gossypium arboreum]
MRVNSMVHVVACT